MTKPPNPQRRSEKSRRATLDAALELCVEQGYANVTIEGIAARAGVSKKTIYRWWPSKGAVILEAAQDASAGETAFPDTGDLAADLLSQLISILDQITAPRTRSIFVGVYTESLQDPALAEQMHQAWISPRIHQFKERLRKAVEQGQLSPDADPEVIMDQLYGVIFHRFVVHMPLPDEAYLRKMISISLSAARSPGT
ncbi:TetR/AcrR family transcriptional regulator [Nonomuraea sp. NPDC050783]|uniref:TetR/AcrR family transcriptional regulator n=1 Tax=Nonomuraea sp. NPDC050783 TaxID=3154634 RepID=UPI003466B876